MSLESKACLSPQAEGWLDGFFAHTELTGFSHFQCGFEGKPHKLKQSVSTPDETMEV